MQIIIYRNAIEMYCVYKMIFKQPDSKSNRPYIDFFGSQKLILSKKGAFYWKTGNLLSCYANYTFLTLSEMKQKIIKLHKIPLVIW